MLLLLLLALPARAEETSPDERAAAVEHLLEQGQAQLTRDEFDAARASFLAAQEQLQATTRGEFEIEALLGLADIDIKQGRYAAAGERLDEAESSWRKQEDPAHGARLWTLRAGISFRQRRTGDALQYRAKAVEQARRAGDSALLFQSLTNLARAYLDVHDYAAAIPVFAETAALDGSPLDQVVNRIQLGISQFELNQFNAARASFESARTAAAELGSPRLEGTAIGELGLVAWEERRAAEEAGAFFDRSIAIMDSLGDRVNAVAWRTNKALVLRETGRCAEALSLYLELEAELESIEGQHVWPTIYKGTAQCQLELGRLDAASQSLEKCLGAARRGGDSKRIWECEQLRGRLNASVGNFDGAREAYEAALAEIEQLRVSLLVGRFKADFFENKLPVFQEYAAVIADRLNAPASAEKTFEISERARARAFLDEFARSPAANRDAVPDDLLQQEAQLLQKIRDLRAEAPASADRTSEIARLESELDGLSLSARRRMEVPFEHIRPSPLGDVQSALEPGERMLVFWLAEPSSHLWSIGREGIAHHWLPAASLLEAQVRAAYGQITDPARAPSLDELARSLLSPVMPQVETAQRLLIVPSGILHYFPLEVLPLANGRILADHASTSYLPSASTLVHLRKAPARSRPPELLAVGDIPYPAPATEVQPSVFGDYAALPFSGPELRAAGSRFGRRASRLLTGTEASEYGIGALPLDSYSVLHFATHGWIDAASHSASGLVLAASGKGDDGLLQVREIRGFQLDAELVVLSSCQSGLGRLVTGEGMVGLTRAFLDAGARSVVASLWNVNDQASADFMNAFYASLAGGADRAEALRQARIEIRRKPQYGHPYYWAAWVLTGDGLGEVAFPVRWERRVLVGLALLSLGAFGAWRWNQSRS